MCQKLLNQLTSDSFILSAGFISTPGALRRFLLRAKETHEIREAFRQGAITDETIREFVSSLMVGFHVGQRFEHELALAALAVVLEKRPTDFAEEFLLDLAKLKLAEMPLCIRVARECLRNRPTITKNVRRFFSLRPCPSSMECRQVVREAFQWATSTATVRQSFDMGLSNAKT